MRLRDEQGYLLNLELSHWISANLIGTVSHIITDLWYIPKKRKHNCLVSRKSCILIGMIIFPESCMFAGLYSNSNVVLNIS